MVKQSDITEKDKEILQLIKSVKYGNVTVVIHNSEVVQVEFTNKVRFDNKS